MALDIFAQFATDESKEESGVWVEIGGDAELLIARAGNKKYNKMIAREYEKNKKALDLKGDAADALSEQIMIKVMASTILLGFKNIIWKGKEAQYSVALAEEMLKVKDFRKLVAGYSETQEQYKIEAEEEVAKN